MNRIQIMLHSKVGKILISILLGLGLASIFRKSCENRNCMIFHAPPISKIKNKIYKFNDKCYTFKEKAVSCDMNKKIIKFNS